MLVRMAGALCSYLMFSITETPVFLRMVDDHSSGKCDLLRNWMAPQSNVRYVINAVPYGGIDLLRG